MKRRGLAMATGLVGVLVLTVCVAIWPRLVAPGLLAGFVLCASAPLGTAALWLTWRLTGGRWGRAIDAIGLPAVQLAWVMPLLAAPMLLALRVYPWAGDGSGAHADMLAHRRPWMSPAWVVGRAVVLMLVWCLVALAITRWRAGDDRGEAPKQGLAGLTIIALVVTISFGAVDWLLSLQTGPHSSVFGLEVFMGMVANALAFVVLGVVLGCRRAGVELDRGLLRDLGALLLASLILDFYLSFSQFFIIWNGNLPPANEWYAPRMDGRWGWLSIALVVVRYALPIPALISHTVKRDQRLLGAGAAIVLVSGMLQAAWLTVPSVEESGVVAFAMAIGVSMSSVAIVAPLYLNRLRADDGLNRLAEVARA